MDPMETQALRYTLPLALVVDVLKSPDVGAGPPNLCHHAVDQHLRRDSALRPDRDGHTGTGLVHRWTARLDRPWRGAAQPGAGPARQVKRLSFDVAETVVIQGFSSKGE